MFHHFFTRQPNFGEPNAGQMFGLSGDNAESGLDHGKIFAEEE